MSENQRTVLAECIAEEGRIYSQRVIASDQEWREKLEAEGVTFIDVDREPVRAACEAVYTRFPEWSEGLYERIQRELN